VIFKPEMVEKILAGEKTVTRRPVKFETVDHGVTVAAGCRYAPGQSYALQPGRGKKAVGRIFVTHRDREMLGTIDDAEAQLEGFEDRQEFRRYWESLYGRFDAIQLVDRIQFEVVEQHNTSEGAEQ
jgi:hypothetical protein